MSKSKDLREAAVTYQKEGHTYEETAKVFRNEHDVTAVNDLIYGEEDSLHGDSGYIGAQKRPEAITKNKNGKKIRYIICQRPSSIKKLSPSNIQKEKENIKNHLYAVKWNTFSQL